MKKYGIIVCLFSFLLSTTEMNELLKLPLMIEHFQEHKKGTSELSFWSFIKIHYTKEVKDDDDFNDDMKLPFKSHHATTINPIENLFPFQIQPITANIFLKVMPFRNVFYNLFISSTFKSPIWQPPQ